MLCTDDYGNIIIALLHSILKCLYFSILPGGGGVAQQKIYHLTALCLAVGALRTCCGEKEGNEYTGPSLEKKAKNLSLFFERKG